MENVIKFKSIKPTEPKAEEQKEQQEEKPHKTLKELYGSYENLPETIEGGFDFDEVMELFPTHKVNNMFVVIAYEGNEEFEKQYPCESEIEAMKQYKRLKTNQKSLYRCNATCTEVLGTPIYSDCELLEKIK